jgi:hypothetical protein
MGPATGNLTPRGCMESRRETQRRFNPSGTTTTKPMPIAIEPLAWEPLIDANRASELLGYKPITIKRMAHRGELPTIAFPIGTTGKYLYKFRASELQRHVESLSRPAQVRMAA